MQGNIIHYSLPGELMVLICVSGDHIRIYRVWWGQRCTSADRQRVWTQLPLEIQIYLDTRGWQEKRRKARATFPSPTTYDDRAVGSLAVHPVSREVTSVAPWLRGHMVALDSHDHSGVLLEAENCFSKSA